MPISFQQLRDATRPLEVKWRHLDGTTTIRYRPVRHFDAWYRVLDVYSQNSERFAAATTEAARRQANEATRQANGRAHSAYLVDVVAEWDVTDAAAKNHIMPITVEALDQVDNRLKLELINAIVEDMDVNPLRSPRSETGLSLVDSAAD